ncbi:MAG TPA: cobyrinate a,c-diamide synthase [Alphaproteobacteria bacterium]|nr:cobyrinate a,c-diamide synthase [Alphaproteobacteria bacterium]
MAHLFISAAHKSSGKTTLSIGLAAALRAAGNAVQTFKKGPDYIDPLWLTAASGRDCLNLDYFTMTEKEIVATFARHAYGADISIIEGNRGLYDGLDLDGSNSNAALATLLEAPVVLVIDTRGMTRGIAPLILGYQAFDPSVDIAGVILNKVGGARHERKLRAIIKHYTGIPVLGAMHRNKNLEISERHLGLIPSNEAKGAAAKIEALAAAVADQVDLQRISEIAATAPSLTVESVVGSRPRKKDVRIAIARDSAFGFYYAGDLDALARAGAELVPIDTMADYRLPAVDGLFIGGGFPETHMRELEANGALRDDIRMAIEGGLPTYAECGGLIYLARRLTWNGITYDMAGAIPADVVMHEKPQGLGYVRLRETGLGPWTPVDAGGLPRDIPAHEFHYSSLENLPSGVGFAYEVLRGHGIDGRNDGLIVNNLLASYSHLRDAEGNRWAGRFVDFVRRCKSAKTRTTAPTRPTAKRCEAELKKT